MTKWFLKRDLYKLSDDYNNSHSNALKILLNYNLSNSTRIDL